MMGMVGLACYFVLVFFTLTQETSSLNHSQTQWFSSFLADISFKLNTGTLCMHTCWDKGVEKSVARTVQAAGLRQSWRLDPALLPEDNYELLVVDLDCPASRAMLTKASLLWRFIMRNKWLFFSSSLSNHTDELSASDVTLLYPWLSEFNMFPDSEVVIASSSGVASVYRLGRSSGLQVTAVGARRDDLRRTKLIGAIVLFQRQLFKGFHSDFMRDVDTFPKLHYPVVENLAEQLNFNLELWAVNDYGWEQNDSFTALMGQLHRREIDFAATGFFMRADRLRAVEFSAETYHIRTAIIFRQPSLSSVSNIFMMPFSSDVWICCLIYCILVILIFSFEMVVDRYFGAANPMMQNASYLDIVSIVLGCVCQQGTVSATTSILIGSHLVPEKLSGRITLFFLSLTALFFFTSYSANIVALLQSPSSAIDSLSDLVRSPLTVGIQDINYNRVYFKESIDYDTKMLYEKKVSPLGKSAYWTPEDGIRQVRKNLFAFNVETNLGYKMISETFTEPEKCALSEIQLFPMPILSLPLTKRSGYRDLFTQKVRWQRETGIIQRNGKLWLPQRPKCEDARGGSGFVSVGLQEFLPALKVLFYGMALAMALLPLEVLYHYRRNLACLKNVRLAKLHFKK